MICRRVLFVVSITFVAASCPSPAGSPAERIPDQAAVRGGVACVPRCGEGSLAVENGMLYALSGPDVKWREAFGFVIQLGVQQEQHAKRSLHCRTIVAYDLRAERVAWRHSEPEASIDYKSVAVSGGKLIFYVEGKRLVALETAGGKEARRNEDRQWIESIKRPARPVLSAAAKCSRKREPRRSIRW